MVMTVRPRPHTKILVLWVGLIHRFILNQLSYYEKARIGNIKVKGKSQFKSSTLSMSKTIRGHVRVDKLLMQLHTNAQISTFPLLHNYNNPAVSLDGTLSRHQTQRTLS